MKDSCGFEGCGRPIKAYGLCQNHRRRQLAGQPLAPLRGDVPRGCDFDGCDKPHKAHGYCQGHGVQLRRGRPLAPLTKQQPFNEREHHLLRKYGLTLAAYEELVLWQGARCAICPTAHTDQDPLHVDHCHSTGKVRGLLCGPCNRALGLMKDDTDRLGAAIRYLNS
jgi:hypothetical protein